ncbi:MAG TPA: hypothetical protein VFS43_14440 [Polyangiaceae bacterium]|nr:hypothetical protein [Polyangiaceae bacterium]
MARLASLASLALIVSACSSPETPTPARPPATLGPAGGEGARTPAAAANDAAVSPPALDALTATAPSLSAPKPACAAMARGECHGSLAAACAAIACPSEMCVAAGEAPATVSCRR